MKITNNLGLRKIELSDSPPDITVQDPNWDLIDKHLNTAVKFSKATGTGNAITLSEVTLEDGFQKTFIVTDNNSGTATTINGKPLYKPGGIAAPNLIAGKAVTIWYDATGGCFFIKASAEGNAVAGDVLAGKTFSNDNDTGIIGTMTNHGSVGTKNLATEGAEYTIPAGYHNGLGKVKAVITGLIASVIKAGTTVGGIVGTFTSDATATAPYIYNGLKAYVKGNLVTGTMKNVTTKVGGSNTTTAFEDSYITGADYGSNVGAFDFPANGYIMAGGATDSESLRVFLPNATPSNIKAGVKVGGINGFITGTFTSDANAASGNILSGKSGYVNGVRVDGTMPNHDKTGTQGYVNSLNTKGDGWGGITMNPPTGHYIQGLNTFGHGPLFAEDPNYIPANILSGKSIFGVVGTLVQGKKCASGTTLAVAGGKKFKYPGESTLYSSLHIEITGLTFHPAAIVIFQASDASTQETLITWKKDNLPLGYGGGSHAKLVVHSFHQGRQNTFGNRVYLGDTADAYVNSTGFCLPVSGTGNCMWFALE